MKGERGKVHAEPREGAAAHLKEPSDTNLSGKKKGEIDKDHGREKERNAPASQEKRKEGTEQYWERWPAPSVYSYRKRGGGGGTARPHWARGEGKTGKTENKKKEKGRPKSSLCAPEKKNQCMPPEKKVSASLTKEGGVGVNSV